MRNNGVLFHAKRTKNHPLIRDKPRTLHLLEREVNPEVAEADVVGVAALVVVAPFLAEVVLPVLTAIILTLVLALLHHLPPMVTLPFPLIPGGNHPQSPALIATLAGAALRLKPEHGVAPPNRPGVQPQPLMAPQPLLLLSSHSLSLLLEPLSRLPPPPSFHGRKSPGVYPSFPGPV
jgi:hypothetical protein